MVLKLLRWTLLHFIIPVPLTAHDSQCWLLFFFVIWTLPKGLGIVKIRFNCVLGIQQCYCSLYNGCCKLFQIRKSRYFLSYHSIVFYYATNSCYHCQVLPIFVALPLQTSLLCNLLQFLVFNITIIWNAYCFIWHCILYFLVLAILLFVVLYFHSIACVSHQ